MRVYFIILICLLFSCKSYKNTIQKSTCSNNYEIQYDKSKKYLLSKKEKDKNYFLIYFENNFNDKVKLDINKKNIFDRSIITNNSKPDEYTGKLIYKMDGSDKYIMNIEGENTKTCFEVSLNKSFRIIYLFYYQDRWIIRFSNQIRIN